MPDTMLTWALRYRAHGWSVIPFHHQAKKPALKKGEIQRYRKTPASSAQIREWFEQTNYQVGFITGMYPYPVVLDVDGEKGRQSIKGLPMPPTPMVESGDGFHVYFRSETPIATRRGALPGVDILGLNHQVLGPPSTHPNGHQYRFHDLLTLTDVALAKPSTWVLDLSRSDMPNHDTASLYEGRNGIKKKPRDLYSGAPVILETAPTTKSLTPQEIRRLFGDHDANEVAARFLGLGRAGGSFLCWYHPDHEPSMSLYIDQRTGAWKVHDWHPGSVSEHYALADVYASRLLGRPVRLTGKVTLATWWKRLLLACKFLEPPEVPKKALPMDARPSVRQLYEGFLLNVQCHWLTQPGCAVPFTRDFAMAWCGMNSKHIVEFGLYRLQRHGYMRPAGRQHGSRVFLPGEGE